MSGTKIVRTWSIVPAALSERDVAADLLEAGPPPRGLLADKGLRTGPPWRAHLLGPADQDRRYHRRAHYPPRLPHPRLTEPP